MSEEQNLFEQKLSKRKTFLIAIIAVLVIAFYFFYASLFSAPAKNVTEKERFVVAVGANDANSVADKLKTGGYIKSVWAFNFSLNWKGEKKIMMGNDPLIMTGGYEISKSMSVWEIVGILIGEPYMKWVTIPEGLRKEEIAEILAKKLGWSEEVKNRWIKVDTAQKSEYKEGVYFPDTYLISEKEVPADVAARLQRNFQEKFAPFSKDALRQNIKWDTALKIASLVQREAAGTVDMPLIAGVIWNRLEMGMKLDIDATVQYARGDTGKGWWAPLTNGDKKIDSPYNTYLRKGLPPTPISNPGIEAIKAVIFPAKTKCLYYLHDKTRAIYCAETYEEHRKNIEKYLK